MEYTYFCLDCPKEFVIIAKIGTATKTDCPHCGSKNVRRRWFPVSVHFKGKGFSKAVENKE